MFGESPFHAEFGEIEKIRIQQAREVVTAAAINNTQIQAWDNKNKVVRIYEFWGDLNYQQQYHIRITDKDRNQEFRYLDHNQLAVELAREARIGHRVLLQGDRLDTLRINMGYW